MEYVNANVFPVNAFLKVYKLISQCLTYYYTKYFTSNYIENICMISHIEASGRLRIVNHLRMPDHI